MNCYARNCTQLKINNNTYMRIFKFILLAAAAIYSYGVADACTNVIVTKGASKDGSVMVSYSADSHQLYGELYHRPAAMYPKGSLFKIYEWDTGSYKGEIPQISKTFSTMGNMNEHQLIITETTFGGDERLVDTTAIMDYGSLIYVTLQRAASAREAIKVIADFVEAFGYASEGETFSIADKNEALEKAHIDIVDIHELQKKAESVTGVPEPIKYGDRIVGIVTYRDGSVIEIG